jgi:hypothetical protein
MANSRGFGKAYVFYGDEIDLIAKALRELIQGTAELSRPQLIMARRLERMLVRREVDHGDGSRDYVPKGKLIFFQPRKEDE